MTWSDAQIEAASGYPTVTTLATIGPPLAIRIKAQGGTCNPIIPASAQYDAKTNPTGIRCDIYDHTVNVFGRDPKTGFARRPLDNVGIQYGLEALNMGAITKQQFLDLNQNIGGYDNDGNYVTTRTMGDVIAIDAAYDSGRITYGGLGLRHTPIIDARGYVDIRRTRMKTIRAFIPSPSASGWWTPTGTSIIRSCSSKTACLLRSATAFSATPVRS